MKKALFLFIILGAFTATLALAQVNNDGGVNNEGGVNNSNPAGQPSTIRLPDPLNLPGNNPVPVLIGRVIKGALGIVGSLALLMFIYGGFTWMLSAGNTERVTAGKNTLVWTAIGLAVIFASYTLVDVIINTLTNAPAG